LIEYRGIGSISTVWLVVAVLFSALCLQFSAGVSGLPAGFQEFYLPLPADSTQDLFRGISGWNSPTELMHYVVGVTASSDNTVVYYDHWENGLEGPGPDGADEVVYLDKGETHSFESASIPTAPRGSETLYDGGDRIFVAGGLLQLVVSTWPESVGTVFSDAWEVYPVQAWNTHYSVPVGENLADWPDRYLDFARVYLSVMSGSDGNTITVGGSDYYLDRGEELTLRVPVSGMDVSSTAPVQVQMVTGRPGSMYEMRGYTITPRQFWGKGYYAPVPSWPTQFVESNGPISGAQLAADPVTDIFLYNPGSGSITVGWEDLSGSGSFPIGPGDTVSFQSSAGHYVPVASGVHLSSSSEFWGIASCDTESLSWDWGYSLIPEGFLGTNNYLSWAPGTRDLTDNGSPAYIMATRDDTTVFIDYAPHDGVFDRTLHLERLGTVEVHDPDGDNTGMHIVSTDPVAIAWGESPTSSGQYDPYLDMGYTCQPLPVEWIDIALEVEKIPELTEVATDGSVTFTVNVSVPGTAEASVTGIDVVDNLPSGWEYVAGTGTPSEPTITGNPVEGYVLTWDLNLELEPGESAMITYTALATSSAETGELNRNLVTVAGESLGTTLVADDDAFVDVTVEYAPVLLVTKTGPAGADVGDTVTYTITVEHDPSSDNSDVDEVQLTDPSADSVTYITGDDGDGLLEYPEIWIYEASHGILPDCSDPLVNTATAEGVDLDGDPVSDSDRHGLDVRFNPVLLVTKTGPYLANLGDTVTYTITVEHDPSSDGSGVSGIAVTDDHTDPPTYVGGDDGDDVLEAGEIWTFTVDYVVPMDAPCPLINTATATGIDRDGETVSDDGQHEMDPPSPPDPPTVPVLPAQAVPVGFLALYLIHRRKR
jgi:hypothetical protein